MSAGQAATPFVNAAAATSAAFFLDGGTYAIMYLGTGAGTVDVKLVGPDGATTMACGVTQITATAGFQIVDLPPGSYKGVITGFTANYLSIVRVVRN